MDVKFTQLCPALPVNDNIGGRDSIEKSSTENKRPVRIACRCGEHRSAAGEGPRWLVLFLAGHGLRLGSAGRDGQVTINTGTAGLTRTAGLAGRVPRSESGSSQRIVERAARSPSCDEPSRPGWGSRASSPACARRPRPAGWRPRATRSAPRSWCHFSGHVQLQIGMACGGM